MIYFIYTSKSCASVSAKGNLLGWFWGSFSKMIDIFSYTSPNCSVYGAIDNPDRFEQVFDTYYIPETSENPLKKPTFLMVIRLL